MLALLISLVLVGAADSPSLDQRRLERLERKIVAMIATPRADRSSQCRAIAFGAKPCGGPWRYLVYSTKTTNAKKLSAGVAEYNALEAKINRREGRVSDCAMVMPPQVVRERGVCRARKSAPAAAY